MLGNGIPDPMYPLQSSANISQATDENLPAKSTINSPEALRMQHKQLRRSFPQSAPSPLNDGGSSNHNLSQGAPSVQTEQGCAGFTKKQLHVLRAQILAFRRLKKGEDTLPEELLGAIVPPPLELQLQQQFLPAGGNNKDRSSGKISEDQVRHAESSEKNSQTMPSTSGQNVAAVTGDEKANISASNVLLENEIDFNKIDI